MGAIDIFSGLGSAFNGVLGYLGTVNTNKANKQMNADTNAANLQQAREANAANLDMMIRQNHWNLEQWDRENQYNSPAAQRARLIQAGIAPSSMVDSGKASPLQSVNGAPMQAAKVEPYYEKSNGLAELGQGIGGTLSDFLNHQLASEQVKQQKMKTYMAGIDLHTYAEMNLTKLYKEYAELSSKRSQSESDKLRLDDLRDEIKYNQSLRSKTLRGLNAEYDNTIRLGRKLDAETNELEHSTIRLDNESVSRIASMDASTQVAWYNAKTSRIQSSISDKIADADIALKGEEKQKAIALTNQIKQAVKEARTTEQLRNDLVKITHDIGVRDLALKIYATTIAQIEAQERKDLQGSEIRKALMSVIGIDTSRFLQFAK